MLIVICGQTGSEYLPERRLIDTSWEATVGDIASGELENVSSVIHTGLPGRECLPLIAKEVMTIWADRGEPLTDKQKQFIEFNVSVRDANRFLQAAE
jgi:hypothetical protein